MTQPSEQEPAAPTPPSFILYLDGDKYDEAFSGLAYWVHNLLIPIYAREVTSNSPWCPQWWRHPEAVAQLHALAMAWQHLTGPDSSLSGPANWHRDCLIPTMTSLRDPSGPFAGCRPGGHRHKQSPPIEPIESGPMPDTDSSMSAP